MATKRICDGCETAPAVTTVGTIIPRDYCHECATIALEYLNRRNRAHERAVEKFLEKHGIALSTLPTLKTLPDA